MLESYIKNGTFCFIAHIVPRLTKNILSLLLIIAENGQNFYICKSKLKCFTSLYFLYFPSSQSVGYEINLIQN